MEASVLLGGINRSVFATADDELRPVMNGIYFDITTEDITMVAFQTIAKLVRCKTLAAKGNERAAFILPKKPATFAESFAERTSAVTIDSMNVLLLFMLESYRMVLPPDWDVTRTATPVIP